MLLVPRADSRPLPSWVGICVTLKPKDVAFVMPVFAGIQSFQYVPGPRFSPGCRKNAVPGVVLTLMGGGGVFMPIAPFSVTDSFRPASLEYRDDTDSHRLGVAGVRG
jgi:hypothetical protein